MGSTAEEKDHLPQIAFLVGMGRSGTTLLTNMLNSNPEMISSPENEFLLFSYRSFAGKDFSSERVKDEFLDIFNYEYNKVLSIWRPSSALHTAITGLKKKDFASVGKLVYLDYPLADKNTADVKCIVDKNPVYSLYLEKINEVYPEAKLIVLVRDFRDNVLSRKKYAEKDASIYSLAAAWNYYYKRIFRHIEKHNVDHIVVKYEDLVSETETVLKRICTFLEVPYAESMLEFQDLSRRMKESVKGNAQAYEKINTMHSNLDTAVKSDRVKAYEKELTVEEIAILNFVCKGYGKEFNYLEGENSGVKFSWRLKKIFYEMVIRCFHKYRSIYYSLPVRWRLRSLEKKTEVSKRKES